MAKRRLTPIEPSQVLTPRAIGTAGASPLYNQVTELILKQIESGQLPRGARLPTLRKLSDDLGIAYATVARGVQHLVREGVLEARTARGTRVAMRRTIRNHAIGVLGCMEYDHVLTDTRYYRTLLSLLQSKIVHRGFTCAYNRWQESTPLPSMLNNMKMVDALILMQPPVSASEQIRVVQRMRVPVICVGDSITDSSMPAVHSNNEDDAYRATKLLQAMGHQHIAALAICDESAWRAMQSRANGYRRAMREMELACDEQWAMWGSVDTVTDRLLSLSPRPTALFILSHPKDFPDLFARLAGTPAEPGKGLYVATYDENLWERVRPFKIPFISVEQDTDKIAEQVVEHLLRAVDDPEYRIPFIEIPSTIALVLPNGNRQIISREP